MQEEIVKVADLATPANNTRLHPEKQIEELCKSYAMFGQIRPLVVDEKNEVLAGNGLLEALRRMNVTEAKIYRAAGLTETQKRKLMLADNKTFTLGYDNLTAIDEVMRTLEDFEIPGYDSGTLEKLYMDIDDIEVTDYGKMGGDDAKVIVKTEEAEQRRIVEAVPVTVKAPPEDDEDTEEYEPEEKAEVRKYVLCPKCGEKIWL